jgi:hypothetical protein
MASAFLIWMRNRKPFSPFPQSGTVRDRPPDIKVSLVNQGFSRTLRSEGVCDRPGAAEKNVGIFVGIFTRYHIRSNQGETEC